MDDLHRMRVRKGCIGTQYGREGVGMVFRSRWMRGCGLDQADPEGQGKRFGEVWAKHGDIRDLRRA